VRLALPRVPLCGRKCGLPVVWRLRRSANQDTTRLRTSLDAKPGEASRLLKPRILVKDAEKSLGIFRLAVAIALLWTNSVWAQATQQPVQSVNTQVTEQYNANTSTTGVVQTGEDVMAYDIGQESGPLRGITLRLSAGMGYDDNVFRTESNTDDDFFWTVRPSIHFIGGFGRHGFRLGYDGVFVNYLEFTNEDYYDHRLFADANLDLTRKLDLNLNGALNWGHDPLGAIGTCILCSSTPDTWRSYRAGADLVIGRAISRAQLTPQIEFSGIRYTNNAQSIRDFDQQEYGLRGRLRLTPRISGIAEGSYAIVNHLDPNNELDRTVTTLLGGIEWEATAKTSGEILIGTLIQNFDSPTQVNSSNFNWDVRVFWDPKPYSKLTLFTSRRFQEDASGGVGSFLADTFGVGWRHGFTERLVMSTDVDYTVAKYTTGRRDDYSTFGIEFTHTLNRWLDVSAQYRYLNRRSNIPGINYDDNTIMLKLTTGLNHRL
jgi:hypothetical protein